MNFEPFYIYLQSEKRSSAHTLSSYKLDLEQFSSFIRSSFDEISLEEISTGMVRTWIAYMVDEGYQASSIHRKMSSLNALFRYLMKMGIVQSNPARGLSKPKIPKRLPTYVDEHQMHKLNTSLLEEAQGFEEKRNSLIILLFYETGMRLSELMGLRDRSIDFSNRQIKVLGKRNKMRYVPVGEEMIDQLREYIGYRNKSIVEREDDYFFVNQRGQKVSKSLVYSIVKTYLSTVTTQQKRSPHVLRHTFATHMLNAGADLNVIKEILGHSSLAATQVYTHNTIEKLKGVHRLHPRQK